MPEGADREWNELRAALARIDPALRERLLKWGRSKNSECRALRERLREAESQLQARV